jgi:hypothetical protein
MSLSSLLDKLTSLVSKSFALAAFVPVLVFAFLNGTLLYFHAGGFKKWADSQIHNARVFDITAIVVGLTVAAYMLASVSLFLREVLEGKHLVPLWPTLDRWMRARQQRRLDGIKKKYREARDNHLRLAGLQRRQWQDQLAKAAKAGLDAHPGRMAYDSASSSAAQKIADLRGKRLAAIPPGYEELANSVTLLAGELANNDESSSCLREDHRRLLELFKLAPKLRPARMRGWQERLAAAAAAGARGRSGEVAAYGTTSAAAKKISELSLQAKPPSVDDLKEAVDLLDPELRANDESVGALRQDRYDLLELFDYAEGAWRPLEVRYFNERQAGFGEGYVAPTAMGNVAESMQNYALSRYRLNLETFWTRLQVVIQSNKEFYSILQDAKMQLDFLVACCWLSTMTWLPWTIALPFIGSSAWLFLAVALGGPLLAYFFYALGTTNYAVLADLVSSSVDLYRFSLLKSLHIPLPNGTRQERALWRTLQDLSSFGQEVELSYDPDQKGSPS